MKNLLLLCFLAIYASTCTSQDDPVTEEEEQIIEEPENTVLRPTKISKEDMYWLYEYEGDRVTKIEEYEVDIDSPQKTYEFIYDTSNNITSITGSSYGLGFTFENGLATEHKELLWFTSSSDYNQTVYHYNLNDQIVEKNYDGYGSDGMYIWDVHSNSYLNYDSNNNLLERIRENILNSNNNSYKFAYDDKNHPFKNINPRVNLFLKLPNSSTPNSSYRDDTVLSDLNKIQSFNNNIIEIRNGLDQVVCEYTLIYNEQNYPIEIHPENGFTERIIYIEYAEFPE